MKKTCDFLALLALFGLVAVNYDAFRLSSAYGRPCASGCKEINGVAISDGGGGWTSARYYSLKTAKDVISDAILGGNVGLHNNIGTGYYRLCNNFAPVPCDGGYNALDSAQGAITPAGCTYVHVVKRGFCYDNVTGEGVAGSWHEGKKKNEE